MTTNDETVEVELTGGYWARNGMTKVYVRPPVPEPVEPLPTNANPGYECGTPRAYRKHTRMKQVPCDDCLAAIRIYQRIRRYGRTHRLILDANCGTYSGYNRHTRKREKPCDECAEAARTYYREYRANARAKAVESLVKDVGAQSNKHAKTGRIGTAPKGDGTPLRGLTSNTPATAKHTGGHMADTDSSPNELSDKRVA